jgi:hypothetical protein
MKGKRKRRNKKQDSESGNGPPFGIKVSGWVLWGLLILLLFVLFLAYTLAQPSPKPEYSAYEGPIEPVVGLQILPGEEYVYELGQDERVLRLVHKVGAKDGDCITVSSDAEGMMVPFCLNLETGRAQYPGQQSVQGSHAPLTPDFSQPWMLALKTGWSWIVGLNSTVEFMGSTESVRAESVYRVVARGSAKGRDAFKVSVQTTAVRVSNGVAYHDSNNTEVVWVDAEKRVLLYANSGGVRLELVEAPFQIVPYGPEADN